MPRLLKIFFVVIGILFLANLAFLDYQWLAERGGKLEVSREAGSGDEKVRDTSGCGQTCQEEITQRVREEVAKIAVPTSTVIYKNTSTTTSSNQSKIIYVPITAEGTVSSVNFTDIVPSEFYFDLSDYPGAKEVRFQAYLLSVNNDQIFARLYDNTNKRGIDFSDIQTNSSTFTRVESSAMTIWRGNNKYTVQLRSVNGTQAQLKDAKLKIFF